MTNPSSHIHPDITAAVAGDCRLNCALTLDQFALHKPQKDPQEL